MNGSEVFFVDSFRGQEATYEKFAFDVEEWEYQGLVRSENNYDVLVAVVNAYELGLPLKILPSGTDSFATETAAPELDDAKFGIFTSGTKGRASLIWHRRDTLVRAVKVGDRYSRNIWGLCYPASSFAGLQVFFQAYCNRNKVVDLVGLPQADICSALQQQKVTHLSSTPTFARLLCDFDKRFESVESITLGGEIADSRLFEQIERSFPNAKTRNIYASTEGGTLMTSTNDVFTIPHELSDKIRLRASELQIHSSLLAESLRSRGDASDYFATGDLIEIVSEEPLSFRFVGRQGDWINVGGTKVNPQRVEEQALLLDGVCEAFAYGKANSVLGNIVCLDVVLADDSAVTPQRIREFLSQKLERFAIPQIIQMVGEIAMTRTQKKSRSDAPKVGNQPAHEGPELDSES